MLGDIGLFLDVFKDAEEVWQISSVVIPGDRATERRFCFGDGVQAIIGDTFFGACQTRSVDNQVVMVDEPMQPIMLGGMVCFFVVVLSGDNTL